jgi:sugar phosphate isomerase/epimerase
MKLGYLTDPQRDSLEEIAFAAENNFDYVDLSIAAPATALEITDWHSLRRALSDAGLEVICYASDTFVINNPSPPIRQAALNELRRCIDAAAIVGAPLLTTRFLGWPAYFDEATGYEFYRQLYEILTAHGQTYGVAVALENSPRNSHQLKWFREIYHRLPNLQLLYNVGNGNVETQQSMTRAYLFALADRLTQVHLSDNDGTRPDRLPIGAPASGGLDWRHELQMLRSFNFDGPITVDVRGDRRWLLQSAAFVRELWPQVL